jgi:TolA-binding protein
MTRTVLLVLALSSSLALAQKPEEEPRTPYPCPLAGLKDGKVNVNWVGVVELFDGRKRLATTQIPDFDFNSSKGEVTCKGEKISIVSQMPFKATTLSADVTWKEGKLEARKHQVEDPSLIALAAAEKALKEGKIEEAITNLFNVAYPHNYFSQYDMSLRLLRRALEVARQRYKAGDAAGAAKVLGAAIDYSDTYAVPPEGSEESFTKELMPILNDYGFFLAEAGDFTRAELVLREVVASAPDRAVARLNLGDTFWAQGMKKEAEEQYLEYAKRIPSKRWPAKLTERCPRCASLK